jgi:hypothetical protein
LGVTPEVGGVGEVGGLFEGGEEGEEFAAAEGSSLKQGREREGAILRLSQKGEDIIENFLMGYHSSSGTMVNMTDKTHWK